MAADEQRGSFRGDRRRMPRGGRRAGDRPGRHPTLVVADAYDGIRQPCVKYLDLFNFQVEEATDAEQLLATVQQSAPAAILVEPRLPRLSLRDLADRLAADARTRATAIILMSDDHDEESVKDLPAPVRRLVKPFRMTEMLQEIRGALAVKPVERRIPAPVFPPSLDY